MSIGSLFLWFIGGVVFSALFYLPVFGFKIVKNFLASAANDIRES